MFNLKVFKAWILVLQLGISILVPIFLLIAVADLIKKYHKIDLMLLCVLLGIIVGIRNAYHIIKNYLDMLNNDDSKESELLEKHCKNMKKTSIK